MEKFKNLLKKLKSPSILFAVIFSILSIAIITVTIVLLCLGYTNSIIGYILYALSAICLSYLVYILILYIPKMRASIIASLRKHKFTSELLDSYGFRTITFAIISFIINIGFAVFQGVIAILSRSIWYGALATYYVAISCIRGGLVLASRKKKTLKEKLITYRNCGISLFVLNSSLIAALVQMVVANETFKYGEILIYVVALYAFYKLTISIINLFKAHKHNDFIVSSIKFIGFADALVSILTLQTAMFQSFGSGFNPALYNALTGGAVSLTIIGMGIFIIISSHRKLKNLPKEESDEQKI